MAERRVLEPEVLPPESAEVARAGAEGRPRSYLPLLTGILLDLLDVLTAGPIGVATGMVVGGGVVYVLTTLYRLPLKKRLLLALAAGAYCSLPGTSPVPLGTLVGAYLNFRRR